MPMKARIGFLAFLITFPAVPDVKPSGTAISPYFEPEASAGDCRRFVARGFDTPVTLDADGLVVQDRSGGEVSIRFAGSASAARPSGRDKLPGLSHYFLGNDPALWRTNVPHYARVEFERVYPGINVVYYESRGNLEFDFIVAPGADARRIRLEVRGASRPRVDRRGDLVLRAGASEWRLRRPRVYQKTAGGTVEVEASYRIEGSRVALMLARYDASRPLVIDPALVYSTYLGGAGTNSLTGATWADQGFAIAVDSSGAAYVAGQAWGQIPLRNPIPNQSSSRPIVFVTKLSPAGTLVYSTFLGADGQPGLFYGSGAAAYGIAVDATGAAYVTGETPSDGFPVVNALQPLRKGASDAFVAKLNPAGDSLVYSTYLGGSGIDSGRAIAVDAAGAAYVAGSTASIDFPVGNALQSCQGAGDAFVTKLNPAGAAIANSTCLGGTGADAASGIALDDAGALFVTGTTSSTDFPVKNALQPFNKGGSDAFVVKINAAWSLSYSTYLGGSGDDRGAAIAVDSAGLPYVAGSTASTDFPVRGALQVSAAATAAFVTKLNGAGNDLVYSTYLGGSSGAGNLPLSGAQAAGIAVDSSGSAYVTGVVSDPLFPLLNSLQPQPASPSYDVFVTKLNPAGSGLVYSSLLGGPGYESFLGFGGLDSAHAIAVDGRGGAYITGVTASDRFPVQNAVQSVRLGLNAAFIAKLQDAGSDRVVPVIVTTNLSGAPPLLIDTARDVGVRSWISGSTHTIGAFSGANTYEYGTRYVFQNWSDGGAATHTVTVPPNGTTYTANFKRQYQLSLTPVPPGSGNFVVNPPSPDGYYDEGTVVSVNALANPGYQFSYWYGKSAANPLTITMSSQQAALASFSSTCQVSLSASNVTLTAVPASGTLAVTAAPGCSWTAALTDSWIATKNALTGSGNSVLQYTVALNPSIVDRTGFIVVNGQVLTIKQSGSPIYDPTFFVRQLYLDLLARDAEPGGLTFWTKELTSGAESRQQVAYNFFASGEFAEQGLFVLSAYLAVLGRDADFGGWLSYYGRLRCGTQAGASGCTGIAGMTQLQLIQEFVSSQEFQTTYGALTNAEFVRRVYLNVLGREPDAGGLAFYTNALTAGMTRAELMYAFARSNEFQTRIRNRALASLLYLGFLRRSPEPVGAAFWTGELAQGAQPTGVLNLFLTSAEYILRF